MSNKTKLKKFSFFFSVSFSKLYLAVHDAISQHDILKAFNGNMIALCQYKEDPSNEVLQAEDDYFKILIKPNIMPCLGLGKLIIP